MPPTTSDRVWIPHMLSFASAGVWARVLWGAGLRLRPAAWGRFLLALPASVFVTLVTLPERALLAVFWRLGVGRNRRDPVLVVVGGYRSGTTHLHNLLSCDPAGRTVTHIQMLAPTGWWASWGLLAWMASPFMASRRPMDAMELGFHFPAEDEFYHANRTLQSPLVGRFVRPSQRARDARFADPCSLPPHERARWMRTQQELIWKRSFGLGPRRMVLKNPAHTGRLDALAEAVGADRLYVVHISREPRDVLASGERLERSLEPHAVEAGGVTDADALRREHLELEARYDATKGVLPEHRIAEVRYADVVADPAGEIRDVYARFGWPVTDEYAGALTRYLHRLAGYRAQGRPARAATAAAPEPKDEALEAWRHRFGHDRPARARAAPPAAEHAAPRQSRRWAWMVAALAWVPGAAVAWWLLTAALGSMWYSAAWATGLLIGGAVARAGGCGIRSGLAAAALTALSLALAHAPRITPGLLSAGWWNEMAQTGTGGFGRWVAPAWVLLGLWSAWRMGKSGHTPPPWRS